MADAGAHARFEDALVAAGAARWADALQAAEVLAAGGARLGGLRIVARAGPVRDAYLERLAGALAPRCATATDWVRLPANAGPEALTGALDLAASLAAGRPLRRDGLLARARGGVLLVPMAERLEPASAGLIARAMDEATGEAGFLVIALDEAEPGDPGLPSALADRLGLLVDLGPVGWPQARLDASLPGPAHPPDPACATALPDELLRALSAIATAAGQGSLRRLAHLADICRLAARIARRREATPDDVLAAVRLAFGLTLTPPGAADRDDDTPPEQTLPEPPSPPSPPEPPPPDQALQDPAVPDQSAGAAERAPPDAPPPRAALSAEALSELIAAVAAGTVDGLSDLPGGAEARAGLRGGRAGAMRRGGRRGRPIGVALRPPFPEARPDVIATLRAAAPWQKLRARTGQTGQARPATADGVGGTGADAPPPSGRPARLAVRRDDFRYRRLREPAATTAIFVVDASGSTALERLGETKGAIEHLLARCYVRRDEVALVAFRGTGAETVLPPTRSLVAAKRRLAALPGGGPTPLAAGIARGYELALAAQRQGSTPLIVLMTDGSGNIALDGTPDRARAAQDLAVLACRCRSLGLRSLCIDIARRPREAVAELAALLGADLHLLRRADARRLGDLVDASMRADAGGRPQTRPAAGAPR